MGGRAKFGLAAALAAAAISVVPAGAGAAPLGSGTNGGPLVQALRDFQVPNLNWVALLPPIGGTTEVQPGPVPNCEVSDISCIDVEINRLTALRDSLGCNHRAVFATTYLELTKELRTALDDTPGLVQDDNYLFTEDALFANFYFDTVAADAEGRDADVPLAWRIAFKAADRPMTTAVQDMLLGINAHVQNDMPFVIAALGTRQPDGQSRKADHDAINAILNRAYKRVVNEVRRRYDPLIGVSNPAILPVDDVAGLELARGWREQVWRNAERLLNAKTPAQRRFVANSIHANAAAWARGIATTPVPGATAIRDKYCAAHLDLTTSTPAAAAPTGQRSPALKKCKKKLSHKKRKKCRKKATLLPA